MKYWKFRGIAVLYSKRIMRGCFLIINFVDTSFCLPECSNAAQSNFNRNLRPDSWLPVDDDDGVL